MNARHLIRIWRTGDRLLVAAATVTPESGVDWLGYKYQKLGAAVTLTANTAYRIASIEIAGGDCWYDTDQEGIGLDNRDLPVTITGKVWAARNAYPSLHGDVVDSGHGTATFYTGELPEPVPAVFDQAPALPAESIWSDLSGSFQRLQTFTPAGSRLSRIDLSLFRIGRPGGPLTVQVVAVDEASNVVGVPLYSTDVQSQALPAAPPAAVTTVYPQLSGLTEGDRYGILLKSPHSDGNTPAFGFTYSDDALYPGGVHRYSTDGGRSWITETGRSLGFATYI